MKRPFILPACLLILIGLLIFSSVHHSAASTPAVKQSSPPDATSPAQGAGSGIGTGEGRVHVIPAMQLPLNATPPIACSAKTLGTIALNGAAQLCLCDGAGWKLVNSDKSCAWKTTP